MAVESARSVLANNNFRIESLGHTEIIASGPGMQGTKQNPLLGATRIRISMRSSALDLYAELGGVKNMKRFLYFFPPALALLLSLSFLVSSMPLFAVFIPWLAVSPWLIISPMMTRWITNRTIAALDNLLYNMKMAGLID